MYPWPKGCKAQATLAATEMTAKTETDQRGAPEPGLGAVLARSSGWRHPVSIAAAELGLFVVCASLATWQLLGQLTTIDRPTDPTQDDYVFYWNFWWVKKALIERGVNPLFCNQIFYPYGTSLAVTPLTFLLCLLSLPITLALRMPDALFFA